MREGWEGTVPPPQTSHRPLCRSLSRSPRWACSACRCLHRWRLACARKAASAPSTRPPLHGPPSPSGSSSTRTNPTIDLQPAASTSRQQVLPARDVTRRKRSGTQTVGEPLPSAGFSPGSTLWKPERCLRTSHPPQQLPEQGWEGPGVQTPCSHLANPWGSSPRP